MARGRCWPTCPAAGGTYLSWASGANCPPQYTVQDYNTGSTYCTKTGVVDVTWLGQPYWIRVWFNTGSNDNSVAIQYSDTARATLGPSIDPTFDNDYAVWLATQPPEGSGGDNGPGY